MRNALTKNQIKEISVHVCHQLEWVPTVERDTSKYLVKKREETLIRNTLIMFVTIYEPKNNQQKIYIAL